jgi:uncharacterized protein YkwD
MGTATIARRATALAGASAVIVTALTGVVPPTVSAASSYTPSISTSPAAVHTGSTITIKGSVRVYKKTARTLRVQYRYNESKVVTGWKTAKLVKTSRAGAYSVQVKLTNSRDRDFRVYAPSGRHVKASYSKTRHVVVAPLVTTKTVTVPFTTTTVSTSTLNQCTTVVQTVGVNGTITYTYVDGVEVVSKRVTVAPVAQVNLVGTAAGTCVSAISPASAVAGSGTATVTVSGHSLDAVTAISFGTAAGTITAKSATALTVTTPSLDTAGSLNVTLSTASGTVQAGTFTVVPQPAISSLSQTTGALSGGNTITISGTSLGTASKVTFTDQGVYDYSGMPAIPAKFTVSSDTALLVSVPAGLGGPAKITVTTSYGTATSTYTYKVGSHTASTYEQQLLNAINARRASGTVKCGTVTMPAAAALTWDNGIADMAYSHSKDIKDNQDLYLQYFNGMSHSTPGLAYADYRFYLAGYLTMYTGEDLSITEADFSASALIDEFITNDTGHCATIMNASHTKVGIGSVTGYIFDNDARVTTIDVQ